MKRVCQALGNAALLAVFSLTPTLAKAQEMIVHLPLDSVGESGSFIVKADGVADPELVPGKIGQAMHFLGKSAVALPFDFSFKLYPQVTVTAWVKQDEGASNSRAILSSASGRGLMLSLSGGSAAMVPGSGGLSYPARMPYNEWIFVAGVVDMSARTAMLYQGGGIAAVKDGIAVSNDEATAYKNPNDPDAPKQPFLIVGAGKFYPWLNAERAMAIDDVRVYRGALAQADIDAIRSSANRVVMPGPAEQIRESVEENRPGAGGPVTTRSGELGQDTAIPDAKGQIDRPVIDARNIGETEKNDASAGETRATGSPSTQEKPYTTDNPTTKTNGTSESTGTNVSAPMGKLAIPGAAEQIAKSADDALPDAPRPAVTAPTGKVAIPGAAEQIVKSADDALPDAPRSAVTAPIGKAAIPGSAELIAKSADDALPDAPPAPEGDSVTPQPSQATTSAGGGYYPGGPETVTSVSGVTGGIVRRLDLSPFNAFVSEIKWVEQNNNPCQFYLRGSQLLDGYVAGPQSQVDSRFGCTNAGVGIFSTANRIVATNSTWPVNSLTVCNNKSSSRLKGIRITGKNIAELDTMSYQPGDISDSEQMPNCTARGWSKATANCPVGQRATGVMIHAQDAGGNDNAEIVGLALICRAVTRR